MAPWRWLARYAPYLFLYTSLFTALDYESCFLNAVQHWSTISDSSLQAGTRIIDTSRLPVYKKKVRPIGKQGEFESRRLWQHVTNALRHNDIQTATEHKTLVSSINNSCQSVLKGYCCKQDLE